MHGAFSHSRVVSRKATKPVFSFFYNFRLCCWGTLTHMTSSTPDSIMGTHFLLSCFPRNCLKWVSITHYFFTQRVCLLLLVFISINFVSAGLTQITTSLSCTFDLKIKLIWEVFKALLIFIWPLVAAMRLASFFLKLEILLPILSLGCSSPTLTTSFLTFFLGHKAEFHIRSQKSWFWFSHHLSCPFCSMSQTHIIHFFLWLSSEIQR